MQYVISELCQTQFMELFLDVKLESTTVTSDNCGKLWNYEKLQCYLAWAGSLCANASNCPNLLVTGFMY